MNLELWRRGWERADVGRRSRALAVLALAALPLACGGSAEGRAWGSPAALLGSQRAYLVVYRPAARWAPGAELPQGPLQEHSRYLLSLYRAGALRAAGRFGDRKGGAMFIVTSDDQTALALVEADPAVVADVYDFELRPWLLAEWAERDRTWPK